VRLHYVNGLSENVIAESHVRLLAGERQEVTLAAGGLRPIGFTGVVRIAGEVAAGAELRAVCWPDRRPLELEPAGVPLDCLLDAEGRFEVPAALPGHYAFLIRWLAPGSTVRRTFVTRRYAVSAGAPDDLEIDVTPRRLRIRVVDAATRAPIANQKIVLDTRVLLMAEPVTDAEGRVTLTFTPGEELFARLGWRGPEQGPFPIPADDLELEIALARP
jgi:hypothetical protein